VLDAYLTRLYVRSKGLEVSRESLQSLPDTIRNSASNIYLDMGRETIKRSTELVQMHPDFAELQAFLGEDQFQRTRYTAARNYFSEALRLIPDYSRAQIGLGNIYFYALEDWSKALQTYSAVLKWDPANTAALFGKGACLYHLGMHEASNESMDLALQSDLTRRGRASRQSIQYYQAESNYYKASNHSLTGDKIKAREFVDAALKATRDSEHVNYLSAVLHFEAGQKIEAREEFEQLIRSGTSFCNSRYYLGRIYKEIGDPRAFDQFLGACSCMQGTIRGFERQLKSIPAMDVNAADKEAFAKRIEYKLFNYRLESSATISGMMNAVAASDQADRKSYYDLMYDLLQNIQPR
jgi:tetratricopeptide (TPR) repeat protein